MMKKLLLGLMLATSMAGNAQLQNFSVGDVAPNFTVTDIHGNTFSLYDYAGKWVVVDLYAYWCGPCATIAPILNDFYKKYGCNGYDIVVMSIEYEGTTAQTEAFETANGGDPNFPVPNVSGLDGGGAAVHSTYGPAAFPTIFLVGPDGKIKNIDIWPISGFSTFENAISSAGGSAQLIQNACTSGVDELTLTETSLSPNPSAGNISLKVSSANMSDASLEVINVLGQVVYTQELNLEGGENKIDLDLSALENGQYILRLADATSTINTNLVIRK